METVRTRIDHPLLRHVGGEGPRGDRRARRIVETRRLELAVEVIVRDGRGRIAMRSKDQIRGARRHVLRTASDA